MADYSSQIRTAARLIQQKGMVVTHRRKLFEGSYDPITDSYSEASVDTDVWAVRTEAGEPEQKNYGFAIGSAVLYVAADVLDGILVSDLFVVGGTVWAIQNVATTAPAERPVLYAVELKSQGTARSATPVSPTQEEPAEPEPQEPEGGEQTEEPENG